MIGQFAHSIRRETHGRILLCSWLVAFVAAPMAGQDRAGIPMDTLAEVGSNVVTARELIERIELMPWAGKEKGGMMDSAKVKALESLVAEHILALESSAQGVVDDSTLRMHTRSLEKLMVRDELYKREVAAKVDVEEGEVREGLRRFASMVKILMLGLQNRSDARAVSKSLRGGGDIDSVIAHPPGATAVTVDTVVVTFGLLERKQEDAVYALSEDRPATEPLETPTGGWLVLYFLHRQTDPKYANRSVPDRVKTVIAKVRKRKELERAQQYSAKILAPGRAEAVPATFDLFANTVFGILQSDSTRAKSAAGYRLDRIVDVAKDSLKPHLRDLLVEYQGGGMTVEDVLESYRVLEFLIPVLRKSDFRQRLNASIKEIVSREFLAREGYRKHLDQTDQVRHDVGTWSHYWLARALMWKLVADVSVTDDEVFAYLIEQKEVIGNDYDVNIREILSDSLRESLAIMEKIVGGADMKHLARENSKRKAWAVRDGESGFFHVGMYPEIGFRALDAPVGSMVGPVKVPNGFSVLTVLATRRMPGDTTFSYDSLKAVVRNELITAKTQKRLNGFLASAAAQYHVKLYYDRLRKVEIPAVNMVTRRFIGFGGSMMAAPSLYPLWQWVGETKGVEEIYP
jgi:peptidyl-prolyl cis-trans isomerase C